MHVVKKVVAICFWSVEFLEDFRRISGVEKKRGSRQNKKKGGTISGLDPLLMILTCVKTIIIML